MKEKLLLASLDTPQRWRTIRPVPMTLRLPVSYAAIALLVALSMGVVLLTTLQRFYTNQEIRYLEQNAAALSAVIGAFMESDFPADEIQAQTEFFSFMSRTRIEVFNTDHAVVADASVTELAGQSFPHRPETRGLIINPRDEGERAMRYVFVSGTSPTYPADNTSSDNIAQTAPIVPTIEFIPLPPPQSYNVPDNPLDPVIPEAFNVRIVPSLYGYGFRDRRVDISSETVSRQQIEVPITTTSDEPLGMLRLSNGPAYGVEILQSVANGWLIASVISVVLAIIVGWVISKDVVNPLTALSQTTARMADGDLSARAEVHRRDEFGTLAQSFNNMARRIEEIINTLQHFVSDAAHEINTPITALRTNLELIQIDNDKPPDTVAVQRALGQLQRLEELTQNLLRLSRLESNAVDSHPVSVNLVAAVQAAANASASQIEQAQVTLHLALPQYPVIIKVDAAQLQQALGNLILNAAKFTPAHGEIHIQVQQSDRYGLIRIEDSGIGIPPDDLPYLFNRFHRGRNASRFAGSGLGLAIAKAIIARFDGQITAENTGHGACFTIKIPLMTS